MNPATDVRGPLTWTTDYTVDGWRYAWPISGEPHRLGMITGLARYQKFYGWIRPNVLRVIQHDWRSRVRVAIAKMAGAGYRCRQVHRLFRKMEESEGWYNDAHDVELVLPVAAAYYFERDPPQSALLKDCMALLAASYSSACANIRVTAQGFNLNNRGGVVARILHQPVGTGMWTPTAKVRPSVGDLSP